jgi:hypothetical protein
MSHCQFAAKASFTVVEGFNLDSFLSGLAKRCVTENNFIAQEYGVDPDNETLNDLNFSDYVSQSETEVIVQLNTDESGFGDSDYVSQSETEVIVQLNTDESGFGDSEVFDWIKTQFVPVMTSDFMKVEYVTMDSRDGISCTIQYHTKSGAILDSDELMRFYLS